MAAGCQFESEGNVNLPLFLNFTSGKGLGMAFRVPPPINSPRTSAAIHPSSPAPAPPSTNLNAAFDALLYGQIAYEHVNIITPLSRILR